MGIIRQHIRTNEFALPEPDGMDALALVDTEPFERCIPQRDANQLRLEVVEEREATLADGKRSIVPFVSGFRVEVFARQPAIIANVLGNEVQFGAIPVKSLDLFVTRRAC